MINNHPESISELSPDKYGISIDKNKKVILEVVSYDMYDEN